jgi:hypothetical protein
MQETELYAPVKAFLEGQGYTVKSEIKNCDLVAVRGDEPMVIVELKTSFSIGLLLQGVDRLALSDLVYVAVPQGKGKRFLTQMKDGTKLCRRLGLGLISVRVETGLVYVHTDPIPYAPRKTPKRAAILLREFTRRQGDPNTGGQTRRKIITAYRQDALKVLAVLAGGEPMATKDIKKETGVTTSSAILQKDYYGWFYRVARGTYSVSDAGQQAVETYANDLAALTKAE